MSPIGARREFKRVSAPRCFVLTDSALGDAPLSRAGKLNMQTAQEGERGRHEKKKGQAMWQPRSWPSCRSLPPRSSMSRGRCIFSELRRRSHGGVLAVDCMFSCVPVADLWLRSASYKTCIHARAHSRMFSDHAKSHKTLRNRTRQCLPLVSGIFGTFAVPHHQVQTHPLTGTTCVTHEAESHTRF